MLFFSFDDRDRKRDFRVDYIVYYSKGRDDGRGSIDRHLLPERADASIRPNDKSQTG